MGAKYTVIGGRGYIGRNLVEKLKSLGEAVYAPPPARSEDLFNRPLGRVIYCAGLTADFALRPHDTVEAHVGLLSRVIRESEYSKVVYLSSTRLYDFAGEEAGRESCALTFDVWKSRAVYDLSKALGEHLCLLHTNGRGTVARLSNVFGASADAGGFLSELLREARRTRTIVRDSAPGASRDYVSIEDVVEALILLANDDRSQIVNVASGVTVSNGELSSLLAELGWRLELTGAESYAPPIQCDIDRLVALGVTPRNPLAVVREFLASETDPSVT